jgi:hypothetical protein
MPQAVGQLYEHGPIVYGAREPRVDEHWPFQRVIKPAAKARASHAYLRLEEATS